VVELTHDTTDDGFHEIQLSGKQLVALFIIATTVIVVVFLCGVRVGRGVRDAQGDEIDQVAAATLPATQPAQPAPVATPPSEAPPPASDAAAQEDLTYQKRLEANAPAAEKLKKQEESKREPVVPPVTTAAPKPAPSVAVAAPKSAAPVATRAANTAATTGSAVPTAGTDNLPTSGRPGTWAVQVIATKDRAVAGSVVKRLAAKGYPAFVVNPSAGDKQRYYKVHVGRYNDRGEAETVSLRIKKEEQFQSWITR
jgi:cell division septation protein DedD